MSDLDANDPELSGSRMNARAVVIFYSIMGLIAVVAGDLLAGRNVFVHPDAGPTDLKLDLLVGAGVGLGAVGLSRALEHFFGWARELSRSMREMLGSFDGKTIALWAMFSALGEEMLFRGLLLPSVGLVVSSFIFGLLHVGPSSKYLPWTAMAVVMGFAFGGMFLYTGTILAPIVAHFTINYFNLHAIAEVDLSQPDPRDAPNG